MTPVRTAGAVVALVAAGAYLRHGTVPVVAAYHVGRGAERFFTGPARAVLVFRLAYGIGHRDRLAARQDGTR